MLGLLVPEGRQVSEKTAALAALPSQAETYDEGAGSGSMPDHILVNEYCGMFFSQFCSMQTDTVGEVQKQKTGIVETENAVQAAVGQQKAEDYAQIAEHTLDYEVEYLLYGNGSDRENLSDAVHHLLAVRSGLNLIHILSDNAKRAQARELAAVITGAGSITPLILVTTFFVMSVWGAGGGADGRQRIASRTEGNAV